MTFKTKFTTAIATGAVLLNALAPMASAATVVVSGNGDSSDSTVNVSNANTTTVTQANTANVTNVVTSNASTGGNDANRNTGGDVKIDTGNATSKVDLSTAANVNSADVRGCNCGQDNTVLISENGVQSDNDVNLNGGRTTALNQTNNANINNFVDSNAKTGKNDANRNTGGDVSVYTGNALSDVKIANAANQNYARVGSNGAAGQNSGSDVLIIGNGDSSDNTVTLNDYDSVALAQLNNSNISNAVYSSALTGYNDANRNTGGEVKIDTGNATTKTKVTNDANFNVASIDDCGCAVGSFLKIAGNGVDSDNDITANEGSTTVASMLNVGDLGNFVYPTSKTGDNESDRNTGGVYGGDPAIFTGDASNEATVHNSGNTNSFGPSLSLPGMGDVHFTSDFSTFWSMWMTFVGSHMS